MMATRTRRVGSFADELVKKAREAMLTAVQIFNNPQVEFKAELFIVTSTIAWTYLLHAHFRKKGIEYRKFTQQGRGGVSFPRNTALSGISAFGSAWTTSSARWTIS